MEEFSDSFLRAWQHMMRSMPEASKPLTLDWERAASSVTGVPLLYCNINQSHVLWRVRKGGQWLTTTKNIEHALATWHDATDGDLTRARVVLHERGLL
jgi:hypothetical protein